MKGEQTTEARSKEQNRYITTCLAKIARALVGDDEERRQKGLRALSTAHPALARRLAERLVPKLQRGDDEVRRRAQFALMAAGKFAVPAVALAAVKSRVPGFHLLAIEVLLAVGLGLGESDRTVILVALIDLLRADREKQVRDAAFAALMALRAEAG